MAVLRVFGARMILVTQPVGWSKKAMYLKRYPSGLEEGIGEQRGWRGVFARAALATWTHTGKAHYKGVSMPRPAVEIAAALTGRGNKPAAEARRRAARESAHTAATARWAGMGLPAPIAGVGYL